MQFDIKIVGRCLTHAIRYTPGAVCVHVNTHNMEHVNLYTYDYSTTRPNKDNHEHKESDNGKTRI